MEITAEGSKNSRTPTNNSKIASNQKYFDTDLSLSGRWSSIFLARNFFVTTERLVLRDHTQETDFVLDTFVVFTNAFHQPAARVNGDLRVELLFVATDAFDVARSSEEIGEIFDLEVITDIERVERAWKVLLVG